MHRTGQVELKDKDRRPCHEAPKLHAVAICAVGGVVQHGVTAQLALSLRLVARVVTLLPPPCRAFDFKVDSLQVASAVGMKIGGQAMLVLSLHHPLNETTR